MSLAAVASLRKLKLQVVSKMRATLFDVAGATAATR
jgi:hypothetical protein